MLSLISANSVTKGDRPVLFQKTLASSVTFEGIGLHSGQPVRVTLRPAPVNTGVVFVVEGVEIRAYFDNIVDTNHATCLGADGVVVRTVEHLLAALAAQRVDNVYAEVTGPEIPVMDGSAWPFVDAIRRVGAVSQDAYRRYIKILKEVTVHEGDKSASALPSSTSRMTYRIDFNDSLIGEQERSIDIDPESFADELARARTFVYLADVELLQKAGLARGGSPDNAIVVDGDRVLNEGGLRYRDEFVRHKMLDAVGDLSLVGAPIIAHFVADKSGHKLNSRLVREVLSDPDAWIVVEGGQALDEAELGLSLYETAS